MRVPISMAFSIYTKCVCASRADKKQKTIPMANAQSQAPCPLLASTQHDHSQISAPGFSHRGACMSFNKWLKPQGSKVPKSPWNVEQRQLHQLVLQWKAKINSTHSPGVIIVTVLGYCPSVEQDQNSLWLMISGRQPPHDQQVVLSLCYLKKSIYES